MLASGAALAIGASGLAGVAGCAAPTPVKPQADNGLHGEAAELALLNRLTWGIDSASLADWRRLGRRDWLQGQLHPTPAGDSPPAEVQLLIDALPVFQKPMPDLVQEMEQRRRDADALKDDDAKKTAQQAYQQDLSRLARDAATRTLLRALYAPDQLREQLSWFWFNHFNVHQYKANLRVLVGDYEGRLRTHALGKFRDLLIASSTHVAMIRYLDNEQNAANRINENYARELMELHTLGVDGGYTQKDVQEMARVLTGMGINFSDKTPTLRPALQPLYRREGPTEFNPARHDMGEKLLFGRKLAAGRGWEEILEQLAHLARQPETATHVSRKLAVYFVADEPSPELVGRMSRAFLASDGDIALTLQAMLDTPDFNASLARKFKDPMHYAVSGVRLAYDGRTILNCGPMLGWLNRLGQGLYNRQTPDGYPMDAAAWSGSGQMSTRFEIARTIGSGSAGLFRPEGSTVDVPAFPQLSNALYHGGLAATLGGGTRAALDKATSPQEWNVILLSSPEFMYR